MIDICVNSDSEELLEIAGYYEVTCIKRPAELAQDESPKLLSVRQSLLRIYGRKKTTDVMIIL